MDMIKLLELMIKYEASDLYITESSPPMYRVNGKVRPAGKKELNAAEAKELIYSVLTDDQVKDFESKQELNIALDYKNIGRFRMNCFVQRCSEGAVIRNIRTRIQSLNELGHPQILKQLVLKKRGLFLLVGATGSGKSTTLAGMIKYRSESSAGHIITIEDPIEFVYQHGKSIITQREIGVDTASYASAIKNAFRQSPDVLLLGEIRDLETMESAITFAETGHLCLATLHSNNSNQAIERIMNFFPPEQHKQIYMQLSMNLRGIVSQRLIPTIDGGRAVAMEIMTDSPFVRDLIAKGNISALKDAIEKGEQFGMQTFDQSLYNLYQKELISLEEALRNADSANNLRLRIKLARGEFDESDEKKPKVSKIGQEETEANLELL